MKKSIITDWSGLVFEMIDSFVKITINCRKIVWRCESSHFKAKNWNYLHLKQFCKKKCLSCPKQSVNGVQLFWWRLLEKFSYVLGVLTCIPPLILKKTWKYRGMNSPYMISVDECWRREVFNSRTLEDALKIFENLTSKWWSLCKQSMVWVEWRAIITRRVNYTYQECEKAWYSALNLEFWWRKFERKVEMDP